MKLRIRRIIALTLSVTLLSLMIPHTSLWNFGTIPAVAQGSDNPPTIVIDLNPFSPSSNQPFDVVARADDDLGLVRIEISIRESSTGTVKGTKTCAATGTFYSCTLQATLPAGDYHVQAIATDTGTSTGTSTELFTIQGTSSQQSPLDQPCIDRGGTCQNVGPQPGGAFMRGLCGSSPSETYQCFVPFSSWNINSCNDCLGIFGTGGAWCASGNLGYCAVTSDAGPLAGQNPLCVSGYATTTNPNQCSSTGQPPGPSQGTRPSISIIFNPAQPVAGQPFDAIVDATDSDGINTISIVLGVEEASGNRPVSAPKTCQGAGPISRCVLPVGALTPDNYYIEASAIDTARQNNTEFRRVFSFPISANTCQSCQNSGKVWCTQTSQPSSTIGTCETSANSCLGPVLKSYPRGTACPGSEQQTPTPAASSCGQCDLTKYVWCANPSNPASGVCTERQNCNAPNGVYNTCPVTSCRELCERRTTTSQGGIFGGLQTVQTGRYLINAFCGPTSYSVSGYGYPGSYGAGQGQTSVTVEPVHSQGICNPNEVCNCVYGVTQSQGGFLGLATSGVLPGSNVDPRSGWTDPDELQNPPRSVPNTPICSLGKDAAIKANLAHGDKSVRTDLIRAGETLVITGSVEKLTASCEGYQYECRPWRSVGCKLNNDFLWTSVEYDSCPKNFDNVIHEEGASSLNVNWATVGLITGIALCASGVGCAASPGIQAIITAGTAAAGVGATIDNAEGAPQTAGCFRICGAKTFFTDPSPTPVCSGGRSQVSVIGAKNATVECASQSCGPFTSKRIRVRVFDPNGGLVKEDFTTTDSKGEFSYTFTAPAGDGEFTAIASVPLNDTG